MTQSKVQCLATANFIIAAALVWLLSFGGVAAAGPYADSGHGDTSFEIAHVFGLSTVSNLFDSDPPVCYCRFQWG